MEIKQYAFDPDHVKSWNQEGKRAGEYVRSAFDSIEGGVIKMLLAVAAVIAGTPSQEDFLTGYAESWANKDTGKSRKADARAVFEAFALKESDAPDSGPKQVERIVAWEANPDKESSAKFLPIKETKSAKDWMQHYQGDFKGFLALAREIRNAGTGRQSQGTGASRKAKVTDKQLANIMESIPVSSANQAHAIVVEATKQLSKMPNFEVILLNEIELLCNQLKVSKQPIFAEAAAKMFDILGDLRDEVRKAQDSAKATVRDAAAVTSGAPQPAQADSVSAPEQQKKAA